MFTGDNTCYVHARLPRARLETLFALSPECTAPGCRTGAPLGLAPPVTADPTAAGPTPEPQRERDRGRSLAALRPASRTKRPLATCHTHTNMVRWPLLTHSMSCSSLPSSLRPSGSRAFIFRGSRPHPKTYRSDDAILKYHASPVGLTCFRKQCSMSANTSTAPRILRAQTP